MTTAQQQVAPTPTSEASRTVPSYKGEVVYIYAYNVAHEMTREPLTKVFGQPVAQFGVDADKRSPKRFLFYKPQMVRLPPIERIGPQGKVRIERSIKLLPIGAISITIRVPFQVSSLRELVAFHDLQFESGSLHQEVMRLAGDVVTELKSHYIRPHPQLLEEEAYTVFCISAPLVTATGAVIPAETWFHAHRREIAALLTQEPDPSKLSKQEADESTARYLSYYENDLVVIDWDAALIVDEPSDFDETLYIMELANLQLAELEAYDRLLDATLERSYRDLGAQPLRSRADVLRELREIRIDLARFNDELSNITKFFGDWHLARIYEKIASRFHLADWHRTIEGKLRTLDDLYQMLRHEQSNRLMVILEATIVLLFIIDLAVLVLLPLK
ncbi:MAG: hypothetical protein RMH97_10480 [Verrucomicrobiales bacterium]|nr:hypothetical protein [Verrucomicrobiales bacterium]